MKEIKNFHAEKYKKKGFFLFKKRDYREVEEGIYEHKQGDRVEYVTSLSFVQEPEFDEGEYADNISQYPLEDVLERFYCHISDFYEELNVSDSKTCYLEFAAAKPGNIKRLRSMIGKHVYNKDYEEDGNVYVDLVIDEVI